MPSEDYILIPFFINWLRRVLETFYLRQHAYCCIIFFLYQNSNSFADNPSLFPP